MTVLEQRTLDFRAHVASLPREEIIDLIRIQDPELVKHVNRVEYVFENKLTHLNWPDGSPIAGRPVTNEELALLVDEPFTPDSELTEAGISITQQKQLHIVRDPILWAKHYLGAKPRAYQVMIIRWPSLYKVARLGRRAGKTWSLALILLHYAWTTTNGKCLVVTPMKEQAGLIYKEILEMAANSSVVHNTIIRSITAPQYLIELTNGSSIKFFTSGVKSGGKADVTRGQEAGVIVLDELDFMGDEDLEAIYAMLQKTSENQPDKAIIGASTPSGKRGVFWEWVNGTRFKEFWYPSYVNPFWSKEDEDFFREEYTEMGYRHEIEADWGEDAEGVYPKRYLDMAFIEPSWRYVEDITSARSFFVMGVDWDKYGAGCNMVVLEVCRPDYEDDRFQNKIKLVYREETPREQYTLTRAVKRIIELNEVFKPKHIYIDRGYGEVQNELLHQHGVAHPASGLHKKVKGISFSDSIEVRDPYTKEKVKKEVKPFMIDNLRRMLEGNQLFIPNDDELLYNQLLGYLVLRTTSLGRPIFEGSPKYKDHIHDALILAALSIEQNYSDLMKLKYANQTFIIPNSTFLPPLPASKEEVEVHSGPTMAKRPMSYPLRKSTKPIRRKMF